MASRRIVIDDSDPSIKYAGAGWSTRSGDDGFGNSNGPVFNGTQHVTNQNGNFSFHFSGSSIDVFGNYQRHSERTDLWECLVDKVKMTNGQDHGNNARLCSGEELENGQHELVVQVTTQSESFSFDRILYSPPKDQGDNGGRALWFGSKDPAFEYSDNWTSVLGDSYLTAVHNATISFNFTGSNLAWFGVAPRNSGPNATFCNYTLDGHPSSFQIPGRAPMDSTTHKNQAVFNISDLYPIAHTLKITYAGDAGSMPLSLSYVYVSNTSLMPAQVQPPSPSNVETPVNPTMSSPTPGKSGQPSQDRNGAIVGGVLGGLALVVLLILLFLLHRRRRQSFQRAKSISRYWSTFFSRRCDVGAEKEYPIIVTTTTTITTDDIPTQSLSLSAAYNAEVLSREPSVSENSCYSVESENLARQEMGGEGGYYYAK
ncbi:hypothetical protein D9615_010694 [Tricholomella constricta]|uniref:Transmembrane protein n=1 Tax=Tricholomella constricta TaxID=117010 RepID=A0A8H5GK54_9AGAR|nr:hypothetical protein D9615_010694 [Tricholomella constricta]